jgi:hypothetical protein
MYKIIYIGYTLFSHSVELTHGSGASCLPVSSHFLLRGPSDISDRILLAADSSLEHSAKVMDALWTV